MNKGEQIELSNWTPYSTLCTRRIGVVVRLQTRTQSGLHIKIRRSCRWSTTISQPIFPHAICRIRRRSTCRGPIWNISEAAVLNRCGLSASVSPNSALDPANPPAGFQSFLWRYPVRIDTAIEYLGITPEEYTMLFQGSVPQACGQQTRDRRPHLAAQGSVTQIFGFSAIQAKEISDSGVIALPKFLGATCLSYCEFVELSKSGVPITLIGTQGEGKTGDRKEATVPDCEPCWLSDCQDQTLDQGITFLPGSKTAQAFLKVFYTSTLRDMRRTYQRAFKAVLFAGKLDLSARRGEYHQSELGYMLANPINFAGYGYYRTSPTAFTQQLANFDFSFLPIKDYYHPQAEPNGCAPVAARRGFGDPGQLTGPCPQAVCVAAKP